MFVESVLPNDFFDMLNFLPAAGSNKATGQLLQSHNDSHHHLKQSCLRLLLNIVHNLEPEKKKVKVPTARFLHPNTPKNIKYTLKSMTVLRGWRSGSSERYVLRVEPQVHLSNESSCITSSTPSWLVMPRSLCKPTVQPIRSLSTSPNKKSQLISP